SYPIRFNIHMYTQVYVRPYSSLMSAVVRPSLFSPYRWVSPSLFDFWAGQLNHTQSGSIYTCIHRCMCARIVRS
ncbi:hypothetical protein C7E17_25510, partial [Stenotrophomonas maltophilia]